MGIGDIGCYGGKFVPTPNIDKLAQDGLLFNQYYSSAPVSSPSRCGLTTGLFPTWKWESTLSWTTELLIRDANNVIPDDKLPSMARAFQNAGYSTGHIGKWHMGGGRDVHDAPSIKNTVLMNTYQLTRVRIRNRQSLLPNGYGRIKTAWSAGDVPNTL